MTIGLALAGCSSSGASEPDTFTAQGALLFSGGDFSAFDLGSSCSGSFGQGYDDIAPGMDVTIRDADGTKVGIGETSAGRVIKGQVCRFDFSVPDIPDKGTVYSVEIANRGEVNFNRADADDIIVTLGGLF